MRAHPPVIPPFSFENRGKKWGESGQGGGFDEIEDFIQPGEDQGCPRIRPAIANGDAASRRILERRAWEGHALAGKAVLMAAGQRKGLDELTIKEVQAVCPTFDPEVFSAFNLEQSLTGAGI